MKKYILIVLVVLVWVNSFAQTGNLINNGDFKSLKSWKQSDNLRKTGKVTLLPEEQGVMIYNPVIDLDGSLYQTIPTSGNEWFSYSVRIKGGEMMRASLGFVALDQSGQALKITTPTKINARRWSNFSGTINMPEGTKNLKVLLTVLDGSCSFANLIVKKVEGPEKINSRSSFVEGKGFSVKTYSVQRPFWELFSDDLNGDGKPEIIGCDVDGIVTCSNEGSPAFMSYSPGAMVYQFASADLNNDGVKDILMSSVDPKIPVKAIDLKGNILLTLNDSKGHERIEMADMDGDGNAEIAVSKRNGVQGSGVAGGVILYNHKGEKIWENADELREFHFADVHPNPGKELIVGGPGIDFKVYDISGKLLDQVDMGNGTLDHFVATDINNDGTIEIIASFSSRRRITLQCISGKKLIWENTTPTILGGGSDSGMNIATGDFDKTISGLETILVGTHSIFLVDARGTLIYQNREEGNWEYWQSWADKGINSIDIAFWGEKDPHLYLSSSRLRHRAYYHLTYGENDDLRTYQVPDEEKHLENIYAQLKELPAPAPSAGKEKLKIFMALEEFAKVPESTLTIWKEVLRKMETPNLEYLVMYSASDLLGHERGNKMTIDQIVERARLLEKVGIPFGYFSTHGGQVWISEEAIRKSKEAAPNMFRFLYIAENLETLYSPLYKDVLKWTDKTLDFCARNNMKMIFKEKHDVWGLLPSDKEVSDILFSPEHRHVTVPIWSTNQPYQPEVQLGGMVGLKMSGLCDEFGMSTQYWNWHEWGRYPRGIRDVSATYVCPSDVMLRLELMGIALGGTWIHIEGGQPYLNSDLTKGFVPNANRHRDLAYELIRKNILVPGATPANLNKVSLVRTFHSALEKGKAEGKRIAYPYYDRNTEPLRKGFIPARFLFETYTPDAFPWIGYSLAWNSITCFPTTPNGWISVLPPVGNLRTEDNSIFTDGEKVRIGQDWRNSVEVAPYVEKSITKGADEIPLEASGTCLILQKDDSGEGIYTALMIDPGYLAPTGVATTLLSRKGKILSATDAVSGKAIPFSGNSCPVQIQPGAFRVVKLKLAGK